MYEMINLVRLNHLTYMVEYKDNTYLINKQDKLLKNVMYDLDEEMMKQIDIILEVSEEK